MKMRLERLQLDSDVTIGSLTVEGQFECWTCEDTVRMDGVKIHGETAIPAGQYKVDLTFSPRFNKILPLVLDVKNFSGIRIHPGNTAADTDGCILPGRIRLTKSVGESQLAFKALFAKMQSAKLRGETIELEIV